MSTDVPGSGAGGTGDGDPGRVDYLDESTSTSTTRRRWPLVAAGAGAAVLLVGAAAWGVTSLLSDGASPAEGVPASAVGFIAVDIDPGKGQQLEAYRTLKKFPALESELGLDQDLRITLFDALKKESGCDDLDFADDVEPWLGNSLAFGGLPGDDQVVPFAVVEITDEDAAATGVDTLAACGESEDDAPVYGFAGDFMVFAERQEHVDRVVEELGQGSMAEDATYAARLDEVGGAGFMTAYAGPDATEAMLDEALSPDVLAGGDSADPFAAELDSGPTEEQEKIIRDMVADFDGAATSLRFEDEGLQLKASVAGITTEGLAEGLQGGDSGIDELPATSILAYAVPIGDDLVQSYLDFAEKFVDEGELEAGIAEFEQATGLTVPEDVQTVLGDGVALSVDSSADWQGLFSGATAPTDIPAGLRIVGDPAEIVPLVEKALTAAQAPPGMVTVEEGQGAVAIALSPDYAAELSGAGGLGSTAAFQNVFPDLAGDEGVFYVSFEGAWLADLMEGAAGPDGAKVRENLEPLQAIGAAGSADDQGFTYTVRVTTD